MERKRAVRRVGVVVLAANLGLALVKGAVWLDTGSLALASEAVNSGADAIYSAVVVAGLYLTTQPPDFEHPHGHERIEPFVSLFVAAGVLAAGVGVAWSGVSSLLSGSYAAVPPLAAVVLGGGAAAKFALYRYCLRAGENHGSPALVAAAKDNRTDVLTALAALIGAGGAAVGYPVLDPIAALVVAGGVLLTGVDIVRDNVGYLVGAAPPEDLRVEIIEIALSHPEVRGAHDVVAHYVGPEVDVSLHIEVEGDMTVREAHDIETEIVESIRGLKEVDDAFVHVDPKELGEWKEGDDRWRDERVD
ncbi:cation diffusion facilitator family transporter [Halolamina litorea]|uniref:Cation diffusion facilitator family transporter n=1 Tax=Halolamina litorea TaxID=1515593 RepID=A0ABD6BU75_9EURY|nr:cation diffusion facilitator family transporter [Halolamina litorea]